MEPLRVQTTQRFTGDATQGQLSFEVGETLLVRDAASVCIQNGWGYGMLLRTQQSGWFPAAYVTLGNNGASSSNPSIPEAQAIPIAAAHIVPDNNNIIHNNNSTIRTATSAGVPVAVAIGDPQSSHSNSLNGVTGQSSHPSSGGASGMFGSNAAAVGGYNRAANPDLPPSASWLNPQPKDTSVMSSVRSSFRKAGSDLSRAADKAAHKATKVGQKMTAAASTTGQFLVDGIQKSSVGTSSYTGSQQQPRTNGAATTTTTTTTSSSGGWFSPRQTTTVTKVETVRPAAPSRAENIASTVGAMATARAGMSLLRGNLKEATRAGIVAGTAFSAEGHMAQQRQQQPPVVSTRQTTKSSSSSGFFF